MQQRLVPLICVTDTSLRTTSTAEPVHSASIHLRATASKNPSSPELRPDRDRIEVELLRAPAMAGGEAAPASGGEGAGMPDVLRPSSASWPRSLASASACSLSLLTPSLAERAPCKEVRSIISKGLTSPLFLDALAALDCWRTDPSSLALISPVTTYSPTRGMKLGQQVQAHCSSRPDVASNATTSTAWTASWLAGRPEPIRQHACITAAGRMTES